MSPAGLTCQAHTAPWPADDEFAQFTAVTPVFALLTWSFVYKKPYWQGSVYGNPADGKRDLPDASLFASNGFWNQSIMLCMSDPKQGGAPCDYSKPLDLFLCSSTALAEPKIVQQAVATILNQIYEEDFL
jgi:hypothetical protein